MSKKVLGTICARGGSTGVPGKNIMPFAGKPLVGWAVETALSDPRITDVIISTDSQEIADIAQQHGAKVPFTRPAELATKEAGKFGVWKHALAACEEKYETEYDYFIDIDCSSPLLDSEDLNAFLDSYFSDIETEDFDGMFCVSPSHRNPYFNLVEQNEAGYLELSKKLDVKIESRQVSPKTFDILAGFYIFPASYVRNNTHMLDGNLKPYVVPREKSFDIDEPFDVEIINWLMERKHSN